MVKLVAHGEVLARFGHALSDPTRARLLLVLRKGPSYPTELAEILSVSRTNLSNHLACLRGCGLVVAVSEGRRLRYELADSALAHALDDLLSVVLAVDPDHAHAVGDAVPAADPRPVLAQHPTPLAPPTPSTRPAARVGAGSTGTSDLADLVDR